MQHGEHDNDLHGDLAVLNRMYNDSHDSEYDDDDWEQAEDYSSEVDEETDTIICPNCQAEVYEDAEQCPNCGDYILTRHSPSAGSPAWVYITAAILLFAMLFLIIAPLLQR